MPHVTWQDHHYLRAALEAEAPLRGLLRRYTRNDSDVEEFIQESYARLFATYGRESTEVRSPRAFLLTVARNLAVDRARREKALPIEFVADMEQLQIADEKPSVEQLVSRQQQCIALIASVRRLPKLSQQMLTLRFIYGFSVAKIAAKLNIPERSVRHRLTRAYSATRKRFNSAVPRQGIHSRAAHRMAGETRETHR